MSDKKINSNKGILIILFDTFIVSSDFRIRIPFEFHILNSTPSQPGY